MRLKEVKRKKEISQSKPKKIKIEDVAPKLTYKGRHIFIESKGKGINTKVFIDGKEVPTLQKVDIRISAEDFVTVKMEMLDF